MANPAAESPPYAINMGRSSLSMLSLLFSWESEIIGVFHLFIGSLLNPSNCMKNMSQMHHDNIKRMIMSIMILVELHCNLLLMVVSKNLKQVQNNTKATTKLEIKLIRNKDDDQMTHNQIVYNLINFDKIKNVSGNSQNHRINHNKNGK